MLSALKSVAKGAVQSATDMVKEEAVSQVKENTTESLKAVSNAKASAKTNAKAKVASAKAKVASAKTNAKAKVASAKAKVASAKTNAKAKVASAKTNAKASAKTSTDEVTSILSETLQQVQEKETDTVDQKEMFDETVLKNYYAYITKDANIVYDVKGMSLVEKEKYLEKSDNVIVRVENTPALYGLRKSDLGAIPSYFDCATKKLMVPLTKIGIPLGVLKRDAVDALIHGTNIQVFLVKDAQKRTGKLSEDCSGKNHLLPHKIFQIHVPEFITDS